MKMKLSPGELIRDPMTRWLALLTLLVNAGAWAGILWLVPHGDSLNPLHYTIYFGINLTGHWTQLFWLPGVGLLALVTHWFISGIVAQQTWRRLWLLMALFLNVVMAVDLVAVIYLIRTYSL